MSKIIKQDGTRRVFIDENGKETPFPKKSEKKQEAKKDDSEKKDK